MRDGVVVADFVETPGAEFGFVSDRKVTKELTPPVVSCGSDTSLPSSGMVPRGAFMGVGMSLGGIGIGLLGPPL